MAAAAQADPLQPDRLAIASKVRDLRKARRWTQAELSKRLHLSQNRLSEIERGAGSFTAEQLLVILKLFNVPLVIIDTPFLYGEANAHDVAFV